MYAGVGVFINETYEKNYQNPKKEWPEACFPVKSEKWEADGLGPDGLRGILQASRRSNCGLLPSAEEAGHATAGCGRDRLVQEGRPALPDPD